MARNEESRFSLKTDITKWVEQDNPIGATLWDGKTQGLFLKKNKSSYSWCLLYRDAAGKQRKPTLGKYPAIALDAARRKANTLMTDIMNGIDPLKQKAEAKREQLNTAQKYLDEIYSKVLMQKKSGTETLNYFPRYFSGLMNKPMNEINSRDVSKWQSGMIDKGLKFPTHKRAYGAFKTLLNDAVRKGYLESNPIRLVQLDTILETEEERLLRQKKRTFLTVDQMKRLLAALDEYQEIARQKRRSSRLHGKSDLPDLDKVGFVDHVKPVTLFAFYTGFRTGDIFSLRWEHLSLNQFSPQIIKVLNKTEHKKPETKVFPISPPLYEVLKAWHSQQNSPPSGLVFPSPVTGREFDKKAMVNKWKQIRELSGLPEEMDFYSLRHNFISQLVAKGYDLMSIASLAGHSDIQMIINHYGHLQPDNLKNMMANSFAQLMEGESTQVPPENNLKIENETAKK